MPQNAQQQASSLGGISGTVPVVPAGADAGNNTRNNVPTDARINAFNGATWDRVRSGLTTVGNVFTGFLNALPWAVFNAAPTARADGQGGPIQAATNGSLLTSINDGTTQNNVAVPTAGADGVSNTSNRLGVSAWMKSFNGATWDRVRSAVITPSATLTGILNALPWAIYNASPTVRTEAQGGPLQADTLGNLLTSLATLISGEDTTNNLLGVLAKPTVTTSYSCTRFQNLGANATLNVKASAGQLFSIYCHNLNAANRYIQIHNTATTPGGGAVPALTFLVPANGVVLIDSAFLGMNGTNFSTGIAFAFSTTEATYTAGAAADQMTQIMYI